MYKILKNIIEMDDYSVQKLSKSQPPEPFEWNTVEGTELNVNDCIGGKGKLSVKGNTYQKSLTGKNLLDYTNLYEGAQQGIITTLANNELSIRGTTTAAYANILQQIEKELEAKTYTLSINKAVNYDVRLRIYYEGGTYTNHSIPKGSTSITFTTTNVGIKHYIYLANFSAGLVIDDTITVQLEEGSTATNFEEYCEGQASPNPDYPQEIKVVTGDNVIKHVGKNKFGIPETNINVVGVDFAMKDSEIMMNGTPTSGKLTTAIAFKNKLAAGSYHIKPENISGVCVNGSGGHALSINITDSNNNKIIDKWLDSLNTSFTLTEETQLYFSIWIATGAQFDNYKFGIQIEEGLTATEYELFKEKSYQLNLGNIELCEIDDYQDELFKNVVGDENYNAELENGAWYKKNAIGVYTFTGNEGYQKSNRSDEQYFCGFTKVTILDNVLTDGDMYCTRFNTIGYYTEILDKECIRCAGQLHIRLLANRLPTNTASAFNSLLQQWYENGHPMKAYYPLRTPTYTPITDPTLISQLEALNKAKWFKGVNHIWTETDNLEPVLEGTYKAVVESEVGE